MNFFQAIILGIVQALTEYLPVSSSAHIRIIGDLMLGADPGAAFTAIMANATSAMPEDLLVVEMDLDRPFAFAITGADGLPLFVGAVNTME